MGGEKLRPYVVVDEHRNTGIFLVRGSKYVRIIARDPHFRLVRVPTREFDTGYKPLMNYQNGAPNGVPYDLQTAARRYLEYGKNAGITDGAMRCLQEIVHGSISMVAVEEAQQHNEVPKLESLSDALQNANAKAPKSSTKNGTTKEAKRPGKAKVVKADSNGSLEPAPNGNSGSTTSTENSMKTSTQSSKSSKAHPAVVAKSVKGDKIAGSKKPAAKKAPAAKSTAKKAPAAKSTAKKAEGAVTRSRIDESLRIQIAKPDPRSHGAGFENWNKFIKKYDGKTVEAYLKAGGGRHHLAWDVRHGNVKLVK